MNDDRSINTIPRDNSGALGTSIDPTLTKDLTKFEQDFPWIFSLIGGAFSMSTFAVLCAHRRNYWYGIAGILAGIYTVVSHAIDVLAFITMRNEVTDANNDPSATDLPHSKLSSLPFGLMAILMMVFCIITLIGLTLTAHLMGRTYKLKGSPLHHNYLKPAERNMPWLLHFLAGSPLSSAFSALATEKLSFPLYIVAIIVSVAGFMLTFSTFWETIVELRNKIPLNVFMVMNMAAIPLHLVGLFYLFLSLFQYKRLEKSRILAVDAQQRSANEINPNIQAVI